MLVRGINGREMQFAFANRITSAANSLKIAVAAIGIFI
jgi:hypothetical protein